jgi:tRNA-splicing ligase RtcB
MQNINGIPVWGDPIDEGAFTQLERSLQNENAVYGALMADHHKGYAVPIGGVIAYVDAVSPSGVGYDIGCGNKAVRLEGVFADDIIPDIDRIMDAIQQNISFGVGQKDGRSIDHPVFDSPTWKMPVMYQLRESARQQLGTVGGGNHYVDVFLDEDNAVWVGCHFGSRGLGHKTATFFLKAAGAKDGMDVDPLVLSTNSTIGQDYIEAMRLAGEYAYAGRDFVCDIVAEILGARIVESVHNHHNFAWEEEHMGTKMWVVRKGATPAFPGQKGFVGGSMGDFSYILRGRESDEAELTLYSTVHGAGRAMSRTAAKGKTNRKTGEILSPGAISPSMMNGWLTARKVTLRGGDLDEAPQAYKRIEEVLGHHANTIELLHVLKPVGVVMAGKEVFDPYRD